MDPLSSSIYLQSAFIPRFCPPFLISVSGQPKVSCGPCRGVYDTGPFEWCHERYLQDTRRPLAVSSLARTCGALFGSTFSSLASRGNNMETANKQKQQKSKQDELQQREITATRGGRDGQRPHPNKPKKFPELGQPGGKDDPRRKGLSGAGTRWYLRFLEQGLEPDEAKKRALERKVVQEQPHKRTNSVKRSTQEISPLQKDKDVKKMRVDVSASGHAATYAEASKLIRVAVLAKEYPERMLSAEELTQLEEAIVSEIAEGATCKIQFGGIHFRPGHVIIDCVTKGTSEWLRQKVTQLKEWQGVELMACLGDDIPRPRNITVFFPKSSDREPKFLLSLVQKQNEGLCTNLWKVLRSKDEGGGKLLTIGIDGPSCEMIRVDGYRIFYRFGKIPVHGLQRSSNSAPSTGEGKADKTEQASGGEGLQKEGGAGGGGEQGNVLDPSTANITTPENLGSTADETEQILLESEGEETTVRQQRRLS